MHRYDPELIAALADGTLDPTQAVELEAQIAADPAAAAELAAQRAALAALRGSAHPRLTDVERTALRAAIARELNLETAPVVDGAPPRRIAWGALGIAAATLAALVAAVPIAGLLNTGGDDAATDLTMAEAVTTAASFSDGSAADGLAPVPGADAGDGMVVTGAPEGTVAVTADSTIVEETTTTVAMDAVERSAAFDLADDLTLLKADPEALDVLSEVVEETTACRAEAEAWFGTADLWYFVYSTSPTSAEGEEPALEFVVYHVDGDPDGATLLLAFAVADCTTPTEVP